jgi:putative spermidine/putrescine transport system ATP-binding protein
MSAVTADSSAASKPIRGNAVEVRDLRIHYGDTEVVHGVSLAVKPGEIVSLLGPSGCGKTTTLRAIAGFVVPSFGDVYLNERNVTELPPNRRRIGMVFQGYALFPHLSVFDNVAYGLKVQKVARAAIAERVMRALSLVKLDAFAQRRPKQLSGGQQQRVAIARALVVEPEVLLLDEPLSNLDAKLRQEMRVEMRRLLKATNIASIFVTHDQEEAMVLSDRVILMNGGNIEQESSPRDMYQQPCSLFAAAFVGQANFLDGIVTALDCSGAAVIEVGGVHLSGTACGDLEVGSEAVLVVKHECVRPSPVSSAEPVTPSGNLIACRFEAANFTGASVQLHCTFDGGPVVGLIPASRAGAMAPPDSGAAITMTWEQEDALIFPRDPPVPGALRLAHIDGAQEPSRAPHAETERP